MKNYWLLIFLLGLIMGYVAYPIFSDRNTTTSTFTGEATVKAAPDEYIFYPRYEAEGETATEANSKVAEIGNGVVDKLVELGVDKSKISTNTYSSPGYPAYPLEETTDSNKISAEYSLTVTIDSFELAEKVLEYLSGTEVIGSLSPQSTFKEETRKKLEAEARTKALADARMKVEDTAEALGVKVGNLVSVYDQSFGGPIFAAEDTAAVSRDLAVPEIGFTSPELLTGEQDVNYFVTVEFELRN
ncbi:SIMPL domain-containing protein [Candidatus Berkelbacteria bacterium]|nr:SIMPL domain-containing protein [Candidatus Berkelbacteria bacterium]